MNIRPSAAIRQNYNEIAELCRKTEEPVFLTKNGEGDLVVMDMETYDMIPLNSDVLPDSFKFVKEEMMCKIVSYKGKVFSVEPPTFVELKVVDTEPGFKGDTATGTTKPATLETGAVIKVPLFIDVDTMIRIDTRTGEYLERA